MQLGELESSDDRIENKTDYKCSAYRETCFSETGEWSISESRDDLYLQLSMPENCKSRRLLE